MICTSNQTDLNSSSEVQLAKALGVSRPVAQRVVALRPYLQPSDLLVVDGIGPGRLHDILSSGNVCATPPYVAAAS